MTELSLSVPTACWLEAYEAQRAVEESAAVGDCGSSGALCVVEVEETTREGEPAGGDGLSVRECICRLLAVVLAHVWRSMHVWICCTCSAVRAGVRNAYRRYSYNTAGMNVTDTTCVDCSFGMQLPACCHGSSTLL